MTKLNWKDSEDIGIELSEKFPEVDPLSVRFVDLHAYVVGLENFSDEPKKSNEKILEQIQMSWYDEWTENHKP